MQGSSSDVTEFLSSMACLTVDKVHGVDGESVYSCQVMDGRLAGMEDGGAPTNHA